MHTTHHLPQDLSQDLPAHYLPHLPFTCTCTCNSLWSIHHHPPCLPVMPTRHPVPPPGCISPHILPTSSPPHVPATLACFLQETPATCPCPPTHSPQTQPSSKPCPPDPHPATPLCPQVWEGCCTCPRGIPMAQPRTPLPSEVGTLDSQGWEWALCKVERSGGRGKG